MVVSGTALDGARIPPLAADGSIGQAPGQTNGSPQDRDRRSAAFQGGLAGAEAETGGVAGGRGRRIGGPGALPPAAAPGPAGGQTPDDGRGDSVRISAEARRLLEADARTTSANTDEGSDVASSGSGSGRRGLDGEELSTGEEQQVRELAARDREVRQHEQAHLAAAGDLATGGPTYTYQTGPDGRRYAVGGEVRIQLREGRDAQETLDNARRAKRAALAPAEPSPQDRRVAAQADSLALQAQQDIAEERRADLEGEGEDQASGTAGTTTPQNATGPDQTAPRPTQSVLDLLA